MNDERIRKIRELSDKAGEVRINYGSDSGAPTSRSHVTIPSKAPGPLKAGLAALFSAPSRDRPRILLWILAVMGALALAALAIAGALLAYLISLGHVPGWMK